MTRSKLSGVKRMSRPETSMRTLIRRRPTNVTVPYRSPRIQVSVAGCACTRSPTKKSLTVDMRGPPRTHQSIPLGFPFGGCLTNVLSYQVTGAGISKPAFWKGVAAKRRSLVLTRERPRAGCLEERSRDIPVAFPSWVRVKGLHTREAPTSGRMWVSQSVAPWGAERHMTFGWTFGGSRKGRVAAPHGLRWRRRRRVSGVVVPWGRALR